MGSVNSSHPHSVTYTPSSPTSTRRKRLYLSSGSDGAPKTSATLSMSGAQKEKTDLDHQGSDAEVKQPSPSQPTLAAETASESTPCGSGKSVPSEPGSPQNKGSAASCLQATPGGTQSMTAELATTSKVPQGGKPPLASRCRKAQRAKDLSKYRSRLLRDGLLDGSVHGEGCRHIQSQDIPWGKSEMKHLFNKTNTERNTESEYPSCESILGSFPGGAAAGSRRPTFDLMPRECEEVGAKGDLIPMRDGTRTGRDSMARPGTAPPPGFDSTDFSHRAHSLTLLPRRIYQLRGDAGRCAQRTHLASFMPVSPMGEGAVQNGTRATDTLWPPNRTSVLDELEDLMAFGEGEEWQALSTSAQFPQPLQDGNQETPSRPKQRLLDEPEEEGQCRICHAGESSPGNPLLTPCRCAGTLQFIHLNCLKRWIHTRIESGLGPLAARRCELCKGRLTLDPQAFNWDDYDRSHNQRMADIAELHYLEQLQEVLSSSVMPLLQAVNQTIGSRIRRIGERRETSGMRHQTLDPW